MDAGRIADPGSSTSRVAKNADVRLLQASWSDPERDERSSRLEAAVKTCNKFGV